MKKRLIHCTLIGALLITSITACSDDNEHQDKYNSQPPTFNDMTVADLETGTTTLHVGKKFVVTLYQNSIGRLLNKTTYAWSLSPEVEGNSQKYTTSVIYDQETANPTDTVLINTPGTYTLTFTGRYNASGFTTNWSNSNAQNSTTNWPDNSGHVNYSSRGVIGFSAVATKKIVVKE